MKKSVIVLWIIGALFLVCSFPLFFKGDIGAGACGIVIASACAFFGWRKYQKNVKAEASARDEAARKAQEKAEYDARHGSLQCSVAGVTFDNDDGTSRQRILKAIYKDTEGGASEAELERYEFRGDPAVRVLIEGRCVGNIRKDDLSSVLPILDRLEDCAAYVDVFDDDEEKVYRADLFIEYAK